METLSNVQRQWGPITHILHLQWSRKARNDWLHHISKKERGLQGLYSFKEGGGGVGFGGVLFYQRLWRRRSCIVPVSLSRKNKPVRGHAGLRLFCSPGLQKVCLASDWAGFHLQREIWVLCQGAGGNQVFTLIRLMIMWSAATLFFVSSTKNQISGKRSKSSQMLCLKRGRWNNWWRWQFCDSFPLLLTLQDEGGQQEQGVGAERLREGQVPAFRRPSGPQPGRLGAGRRPGVPQPASRLQLRGALLHPAGVTPQHHHHHQLQQHPPAGNLSDGLQASRLCSPSSYLRTREWRKSARSSSIESCFFERTLWKIHSKSCSPKLFFLHHAAASSKQGTLLGCRLRFTLLVRSTFAVICQTAEHGLRYFFHLLWKQSFQLHLQTQSNCSLWWSESDAGKKKKEEIFNHFFKASFKCMNKVTNKVQRNMWEGHVIQETHKKRYGKVTDNILRGHFSLLCWTGRADGRP